MQSDPLPPDMLCDLGAAKFKWWKDWRGECVAVVGSGPSTKTAGVEKLRDRIHVVVVNDNFNLCPWADVLYSAEAVWWQVNRKDVKKFSGLKLCFEFTPDVDGLQRIEIVKTPAQKWLNEFSFAAPGVIGSGGHSGFQAVNLAAQFGATAIALIGFDMHIGAGVHWHGMHRQPLRNPDAPRFEEWRKILDGCAPQLAARGIDVVNCSPVSALHAFPKLTIEQMLQRWSL